MTEPISPATHPSIDFFGLTLLNLCFPKLLPIMYAKISVAHDTTNTYPIKTLPCSKHLISSKNIINSGT